MHLESLFHELKCITVSLLNMRTIKLLLILAFTLSVSVSAETVYKTRDAEGNVIFSDVPSEGAEKIVIEKAQTLNTPIPKRIGDRRTTKLSPEGIKYTQFVIINPENDSTIHSNEGIVNVSAELAPELDDKHAIFFLIDGNEVSEGKSLQLSMSNLDRGTHNVTAVIRDEKNKVIKRTNSITFHLRKASKLFKNRVNADNINSTDSPATTAPVTPAL